MQIITYSEHLLVKRHRGTMPVILTCPHDGTETPAGVHERSEDDTPSNCQFKTGRDTHSAEITEAVAQRILEWTGLSPYVVIARFHRKFIDANRKEECAFTDSDARPFYNEYHTRISGYVTQILSQNNDRGFLFDIHGTSVLDEDPADIYLGTANGGTLRPGFNRRNLFMQHGIHGLLKWARHLRPVLSLVGAPVEVFSYRVSPADEGANETGPVNGGFTVRHYGATMSSVQIEVASTIRNDTTLRQFFIDDLAWAIANFVRRHAPF